MASPFVASSSTVSASAWRRPKGCGVRRSWQATSCLASSRGKASSKPTALLQAHADHFPVGSILAGAISLLVECPGSTSRRAAMQTVKFVHWQEGDAWIGYLQDYPDYWTQGESLDDLKAHLKDLYDDLTSGELPGIRKVDELIVS